MERSKEEYEQEIVHILNLTFLKQEVRLKDIEKRMIEDGWTVNQVQELMVQAANKTNWAKNNILQNQIHRQGADEHKIKGYDHA